MMARLGDEVGLRLVATNDSHYLSKDDAFAHEVLLCIGTGKTLGDEKRSVSSTPMTSSSRVPTR